jgi:hypothetical protein
MAGGRGGTEEGRVCRGHQSSAAPVNWQAVALKHAAGLTLPYDDRPILSTFLPLNKTLNDPLAEPVDVETADPAANIFTNLSLWFGFQYIDDPGMIKIGDRLEYRPFSLDVIVSDRDCVRGADVQSSHPDRSGVLYNRPYDNDEHPWLGGNLGVGVATGQAIKITISYWLVFGTDRRGPVDTNYTFQDLSVQRFDNVAYDEGAGGAGNERFVRIRTFVNKEDTWQKMPRR